LEEQNNKLPNCPASDSSILCPVSQDNISDDFEHTVELHHYNFPEGAFCKWEILNPNKYEVEVEKSVSSN
jgi:hypothetical protein